MLQQAGALADDEMLPELRAAIYAKRGRPEVDDEAGLIMYLLDTDTLTHLHAGHPQAIKRLRELADPDIGTTVITKIELLRGRFDFALKAATGSRARCGRTRCWRAPRNCAEIAIVPLDAPAAEQFDRLRVITALNKMGRADQSKSPQHRAGAARHTGHAQPAPLPPGARVEGDELDRLTWEKPSPKP